MKFLGQCIWQNNMATSNIWAHAIVSWQKTYKKYVLSVISKYLRDIHICYGHQWIALTKKHRYTQQNRDSVISMAAILNEP